MFEASLAREEKYSSGFNLMVKKRETNL